ncbi:MAG TPA: hypothetical protein DIU15_16440 [Deltaproteobacteria bacterium]|nr:hypothetical protein [Deltaproteobacteria bacterium]HCP47632.1 hypothetical protein [Deltaproteobacteria bacterium]
MVPDEGFGETNEQGPCQLTGPIGPPWPPEAAFHPENNQVISASPTPLFFNYLAPGIPPWAKAC